MNVERYNDIKEKAKDHLAANNSKFTDFNEGSGIMTLIESFSRIVEKFYIDTRNGFLTNLRAIPYQIFNFQRKTGDKATGSVIFSASSPATQRIVIGIGTEVKAGTCVYETTSIGEIGIGATESNEILISAKNAGTDYNVSAGEVNIISSIVDPLIVSVINPNKIDGGSDNESDNAMFQRFNEWINGLSGTNEYSLKSAILNCDNSIRDINIVEHFPPEDNYNFTIYIDNNSDVLRDVLKQKIILAVNGDGTENNPGHKAPGINWTMRPVTRITVDLSYKVSIENTKEDAISEINDVIRETINGLGIGNDVILSTIIARIRTLNFVKDFEIITPLENIEIPKTSIAVAGKIENK